MINETSKQAKKQNDKQGVTAAQCKRVLQAIKWAAKHNLIATRRGVAHILKMDTSSVAGRVNELIKGGFVEETHKVIEPSTKRWTWAIKVVED